MRSSVRWGSLGLVLAVAGFGACRRGGPSRVTPNDTSVADTPRVRVVRDPEMEQRLAHLELLLLEREGQIEALQGQLEDARQEVVRAMAKLQTLATRAEAASGMAEAEIAVEQLRGTGGPGAAADLAQARRLLQMSTEEFNQSNYGGALYLANQSRGLAAAARGRLSGVDRGVQTEGEVLFAVPLRLQATGESNVREGPGRNYPVLFTVERGTLLIGMSYLGQWVRVTDETGRTGWAFQALLGRRGSGRE